MIEKFYKFFAFPANILMTGIVCILPAIVVFGLTPNSNLSDNTVVVMKFTVSVIGLSGVVLAAIGGLQSHCKRRVTKERQKITALS